MKFNFENEKWTQTDESWLIDFSRGISHDDESKEDPKDLLGQYNSRADVHRSARGVENKCRRLSVQFAYKAGLSIVEKVAAYAAEKKIGYPEAVLNAGETMDGEVYETIVALRRFMTIMTRLAKTEKPVKQDAVIEQAPPQQRYVTASDLDDFKKEILAALRK